MDSLIYFKALGDSTRLRLVNILLYFELSVSELVKILDMGQSRISRHLKILGDAGFLESRKHGVWGYYAICRNNDAAKFIDAIRYLFDTEKVFADDLVRTRETLSRRRSDSIRFFDTIAETWGRMKREIIGDFDLNRAICSAFNTDSELFHVAVDLGCGTGDLLADLAHYSEKVIGVDSSTRMLAEARKRFEKNHKKIEIRLGEIEHLPIGNGEADLAVISLVLQYIQNPADAVAETARIIKPGGIFVIAEFDRHDNPALTGKYGAKWPGFSKEDIGKLLDTNGFTIKSVSPFPLDAGLTIRIFKAKKTSKTICQHKLKSFSW